MPGAVAATGVTLRTSAALRVCDKQWQPLQRAIEGRVPWEAIDECEVSVPPVVIHGTSARWAYLESDFHYTSHRTLCRSEGGPYAVDSESVGTRVPALFIFIDACDAVRAAGEAQGDPLAEWLARPAMPFILSRAVLILCGAKPASIAYDTARVLAESLVQRRIESVEVRDAEHAADYVVQCALSVVESRKRRAPSRFKVPGSRCQTLPRDPTDKLRITWVSQLMQLPGVSEEMAKAICAQHPTPADLLKAVASVVSAEGGDADENASSVIAGAFLGNLEIPIRGKKGTRRLGEVVSRRVFELFHPVAQPEHLLL